MSKVKKIVDLFLILAILFCVGLAFAQDDAVDTDIVLTEKTEEVKTERGFIASLINEFKVGGGWMYPILFLGLGALAIALERFIKLFLMQRFNTGEFYIKLKTYIRNEKFDEAIKICQAFQKTTMGSIFLYGLKGFTEAKEQGKTGRDLGFALQRSFDEACLNELPKLEKRLHYLETFGNMATLMGLLGTIFGLVQSFAALGNLPPEEANQALTNGIAIAMRTTAFGLIVALPTMLVKSFLQGKSQNIANEIDEYGVKIINAINKVI